MKKIIFLIFIFFTITGCNSKTATEDVVFLYSINGRYVTIDNTNSNLLIACKTEKYNQETFLLLKLNENKFAIKTLDNIYISVDTANHNSLTANAKILQKEGVFQIIFDKTYDRVLITAFNNKFVGIGKDNVLRADAEKEPLTSSIYIDIKRDKFLNSYFNDYQLIFLINAILLIFLSILFFHFRRKINLSLVLLILGGISLRIFAVILDPYLNIWDERFHALVAKSMMENPLKPMLYSNPVLPYDTNLWSMNHIWLHKQPLFLWQIALCFKLFGVNEFALRIPSLLMSSLLIPVTYRIGKLICNRQIAFYAAVLFCCSFYTIELVSGVRSTDHNDMAFAFYLILSIWAWTEFYHSNNRKWILFIGLFAGAAILNKWLTGLLVYSGWGLVILFNPNDRKSFSKYLEILYAFIITIIVVLPWQLYILYKYPVESKYEYAYNSDHLFNALEGHGGNFWFHFNEASYMYGLHFVIIILAVIFLYTSIPKKEYKAAFTAFIVITYLFFSVVATKMSSFTYCISVLIFIALAALLFHIMRFILDNKKYHIAAFWSNSIKTIVVFAVCIFSLNIHRIELHHSAYKKNKINYRIFSMTYTPVYKRLNTIIPGKNYVIFNSQFFDYPSIMFYSGITTYEMPITKEFYTDLKKRNIKMATFDNGDLPDFVKNDKEIIIIN